MKKIALCLSGQLRSIKLGYEKSILPFILDGNEVDVFIHTWVVEDEQNGKPYVIGDGSCMSEQSSKNYILDVMDMYKPIKCLVEKQIPFQKNEYDQIALPGNKSRNIFSMFYSIWCSNELKKEYEIQNNFKYDIVIRCRFDIKLNEKINFEVDTSKIHIPYNCFDNTNGYVDSVGYSNSQNMDVYCGVFYNIDNIIQTTKMPFCGEYILKKHLDYNNIPIEKTYWWSLFR